VPRAGFKGFQRGFFSRKTEKFQGILRASKGKFKGKLNSRKIQVFFLLKGNKKLSKASKDFQGQIQGQIKFKMNSRGFSSQGKQKNFKGFQGLPRANSRAN